MQACEADEGELQIEQAAHLVALVGLSPSHLFTAIEGAPALETEAEQRRVLIVDPRARVEHGDDDLRAVDRLQRLHDAPLLDDLVHARAPPPRCR